MADQEHQCSKFEHPCCTDQQEDIPERAEKYTEYHIVNSGVQSFEGPELGDHQPERDGFDVFEEIVGVVFVAPDVEAREDEVEDVEDDVEGDWFEGAFVGLGGFEVVRLVHQYNLWWYHE